MHAYVVPKLYLHACHVGIATLCSHIRRVHSGSMVKTIKSVHEIKNRCSEFLTNSLQKESFKVFKEMQYYIGKENELGFTALQQNEVNLSQKQLNCVEPLQLRRKEIFRIFF